MVPSHGHQLAAPGTANQSIDRHVGFPARHPQVSQASWMGIPWELGEAAWPSLGNHRAWQVARPLPKGWLGGPRMGCQKADSWPRAWAASGKTERKWGCCSEFPRILWGRGPEKEPDFLPTSKTGSSWNPRYLWKLGKPRIYGLHFQ